MNISKVSTGLNAAFGLKFRVAFGEFPQYGVSFKVQGSILQNQMPWLFCCIL